MFSSFGNAFISPDTRDPHAFVGHFSDPFVDIFKCLSTAEKVNGAS